MPPPAEPPPKRLIVPGSESTPAGGAPPRILVPGEPEADARPTELETEGAAAPPPTTPRIILPPGATAAADDDLPAYPRLRPLVLVPFSDGQRELLLVNDPLGVIPGQPVLAVESLALIQLLDGATSLTDITAALMRESRDLRVANMVRDFVAKLDQMLMLESPRFERAYQELRDAYHPLEIRQAALAGRSYPAEPEPLTEFLAGHFAEAERWAAEDAAETRGPAIEPARILGLMAPHLDPNRSGATIARAYLELAPELADEPLRVVVFGTGHSLYGDLFALTRKHFETPLGKLECDTRFVDAVAARLGDAAYRSELAHREEHSIEFQAVYLKYRFGDRRVKIVPILCGGFHALLDEGTTPRASAEFEALIEAVRETAKEQGGRTVYVAGVDFSHVGPRFGDPSVDDRTRAEVETHDRDALEAARRGDADGWFRSIAAHDDSTRICGYAPTYALLRCVEPGEGRLLRYERSDEKDGSFVSVASMAW